MMMKRLTMSAAITVMALTATGLAHAEGPDLIAVRQAGFSLNSGDFAGIRAVVAAKGDISKLEAPARGIAKWAAVVPSLFPKGTEKGGDTKALPEIWSDSAGFQKAAMTMGAAATKLADSAKAGNMEAVEADVKALGETCGGCHKVYKAK